MSPEQMPDIVNDDEIVNVEEDHELTEMIRGQQELIKAETERRTAKYMKKHAREIKRLRAHGEKCLLEENKEGYIYAIGKLRTLIGKPVTRDVLESMYQTSIDEVLRIIENFQAAKESQEQ